MINLLEFLIDKIFVEFGGRFFGVPLTTCQKQEDRSKHSLSKVPGLKFVTFKLGPYQNDSFCSFVRGPKISNINI